MDWTKSHVIVIEYELEGKRRRYVPDFRVIRTVGTVLEEIKDYEDETKLTAKLEALRGYCDVSGIHAVYFDA